MNLHLSAPIRKTLAAAILFIVALVVWTGVVSPIIHLSTDRSAEISDLTDQLARITQINRRKPALEQRARELHTQVTTGGDCWIAVSTTSMAAKIQDIVRQAVANGGGRLLTSAENDGQPQDGFRQVSLHFGVEGPIATLVATMTAIEAARPAIFVDDLSVSASGEGSSSDHPPNLNLTIDTSAYLLDDRL